MHVSANESSRRIGPRPRRVRFATLILGFLCAHHGPAAESPVLAPELASQIDAQVQTIGAWGNNPSIVAAVQAHNAHPSEPAAAMTPEAWKKLTILDPFVRSLSKNSAADFLRAHKSEAISEAFISGTNGTKVAFLAKPTNWCHLGKPKHDVPMAGRHWQGPVETDESTGLRQVQVAVPVRDGDKVIGSIVVGLNLARLVPPAP